MSINIEILYDHYKDTYENIKQRERRRSKLFIINGVILFLLLLFGIEPTASVSIIVSTIKQRFGADLADIFPVVVSALWLLLLYTTMNYYQVCIHIERQYKYLHEIEALLADMLTQKFSREGKSYKKDYPLLIKIIYILYKGFFPAIYMLCISTRIGMEITLGDCYLVFDLIISIATTAIIFLYFLSSIKIKTKKGDPEGSP
jgi:hypothetical protein